MESRSLVCEKVFLVGPASIQHPDRWPIQAFFPALHPARKPPVLNPTW
ncbi:rCG51819, isoform CRA_a [Rattus norvegicus]|uniref:RCG51819, isoform CRA_a n=1 Tax=Rattus norvegicus TaxID=10116 RepID=A6K325_RAT|nr:rCG51819, isoform CRA_a [Rattus norvegicus]